jgi:hypothetical protein
MPTQDSVPAEESFNMDDDLAMFTNTQFFDFETGQNTDYTAPPVKPETVAVTQEQQSRSEDVSAIGDLVNYDFTGIAGDFNLDYASTYTSPTIPTFSETLGSLQPIQANPQAVYPSPISQHAPAYPVPAPIIGEKRKSDASSVVSVNSPNRPLNFEEASRIAAEEDKRRRNTAASARFRIKKKQREQALEKSAKEMSDKVAALESRINQLETENKWLKNLIMEKNEKTGKGEDTSKIIEELGNKEAEKAKDRIGDSVTVAA